MENEYVIFKREDLKPFSIADFLVKQKGIVFNSKLTAEQIKGLINNELSGISKK